MAAFSAQGATSEGILEAVKEDYAKLVEEVSSIVDSQEDDAQTRTRTSMRRHCLSSRRGGRSLWQRRNCSCPSRYASIRTSCEPTLRWLGALWDPS